MSGDGHTNETRELNLDARPRTFVGTPMEEWERLVHEQDELMAATMRASREVRGEVSS